MGNLDRCESCRGFVPGKAVVCPHCDLARTSPVQAKWKRLGVGASSLLGAGSASMTLMVCYGVAPHPAGNDVDCDGYPMTNDCNDHDASVYPGANESAGDGID